MSRDLLLFLEDIEKACAKISRYSERLSPDEVFADEMRFDGISITYRLSEKLFIKNVPEDYRQRHPDIAWPEIAGMRDFVAHAYFALDLDILWNALEKEVPSLLKLVRNLIETERNNRP